MFDCSYFELIILKLKTFAIQSNHCQKQDKNKQGRINKKDISIDQNKDLYSSIQNQLRAPS